MAPSPCSAASRPAGDPGRHQRPLGAPGDSAVPSSAGPSGAQAAAGAGNARSPAAMASRRHDPRRASVARAAAPSNRTGRPSRSTSRSATTGHRQVSAVAIDIHEHPAAGCSAGRGGEGRRSIAGIGATGHREKPVGVAASICGLPIGERRPEAWSARRAARRLSGLQQVQQS